MVIMVLIAVMHKLLPVWADHCAKISWLFWLCASMENDMGHLYTKCLLIKSIDQGRGRPNDLLSWQVIADITQLLFCFPFCHLLPLIQFITHCVAECSRAHGFCMILHYILDLGFCWILRFGCLNCPTVTFTWMPLNAIECATIVPECSWCERTCCHVRFCFIFFALFYFVCRLLCSVDQEPCRTPDCKRMSPELSSVAMADACSLAISGKDVEGMDNKSARQKLCFEEEDEPLEAKTPGKHQIADQLESPLSGEKVKNPRKRKISLLDTGKARARGLGVDFHKVFQPKHSYQLERYHWQNFLLALGTHEEELLECPKCQAILANVAKVADRSEIVPAPKTSFECRLAELKAQEGMRDAKRGRRPKSHEKREPQLTDNIHRWLAVRRPGMYQVIPGKKCMLKCLKCNSNFSYKRDSGPHWVLQHEAYPRHSQCLDSKICKGKQLNEDIAETTLLKDWLKLGSPWSTPTLQQSCYLKDSQEDMPFVQTTSCSDQRTKIAQFQSHCRQCELLSQKACFWQKVSNWILRSKLVDLLRARFLQDQQACACIVSEIGDSLYFRRSEIQLNLGLLAVLPYSKLYRLVETLLVSIPPSSRNAAAQTMITQHFSWLPRQSVDMVEGDKKALVSHARFLGGSTGEAAEFDLAEKILKGALRGDTVVKVLVASLIQKGWASSHNVKRATASAFPGVDEAALQETAFALATCQTTKRLEKLVGFNSNNIPRISYAIEGLPQPLGASCALPPGQLAGVSQVQSNCEIALELCERRGSRDWMLSFDETCYFPQYCLLLLGWAQIVSVLCFRRVFAEILWTNLHLQTSLPYKVIKRKEIDGNCMKHHETKFDRLCFTPWFPLR